MVVVSIESGARKPNLDGALPVAPSTDNTPRYRIGAVAKLTGLTAHQLRVWEKRYGSFEPSRSAGGGRLYSHLDVDRFRLIKQLTELGNSIGQIAQLSVPELQGLLKKMRGSAVVQSVSVAGQQVREQFLAAIREMRTSDAERIVAHSSLAFEPRAFVIDVLVPLLRAVGALWEEGDFSIAHEHAATEVLRSQLGFLMRTYAQPADAPIAIVATPSGELHGLGALSAALIAAGNSQRVIYLGPNVPLNDLLNSARSSGASTVLVSILCSAHDPVTYLSELRLGLSGQVQILMGGAATARLEIAGVQRLGSLEALNDWFQRRARPRSS